jgi:hypothetical protein
MQIEKITRSADNTRVRIGAIAPSFPPTQATPATVKDQGQTRMGAIAPAFPR